MRKIIKELAGWLVYIVIVVIIAWGFVTFVAQRTQVSGASMETTLSDGDQLIVDKISYQFREPERFEIIVFPYQYEAGTYYIKRIIGLPGETVQILDGSVYINGEKLEEHYGNEVMEEAGIAAEPVTRVWMSILCLVITGTTARTAVPWMWELCMERIL